MWTVGIVRTVFYGQRRYTEIQRELGIATNVLAARLENLVEHEILERVAYQDKPVRFEYMLTAKGADLAPAIVALREWGRAHLLWDEPPPPLRHAGCGGAVAAVMTCAACGRPVDHGDLIGSVDRASGAYASTPSPVRAPGLTPT
jgi:DNA-binding HxlR family transcriptional regulator